MVFTQKRFYPSTEEHRENGDSDEPLVKRRKAAIGNTACQKPSTCEASSEEPKENENSTLSNDSGLGEDVSEEGDITSIRRPVLREILVAKRNTNSAPKNPSNTSENASTNDSANIPPPAPKPSSSKRTRKNGVKIIDKNTFCNSKVRKAFKKMVQKSDIVAKACEYSDCQCSDRYCENFGTEQECPNTCKNEGGICKNRFITENRGLKIGEEIELFQTKEKGLGIQSMVKIEKGTFIGEYCGEIIDQEEMEKRDAKRKNGSAFYLMDIDDFYIDGERSGSYMRYLNHSCDPNCNTRKYLSADGTPHRCLFATKDIPAGEELTITYSARHGRSETKFKCYCRAETCETFFKA